MKVCKRVMLLILTWVLLIGTANNVNAAERIQESNNYVPSEKSDISVVDMMDTEVQKGEKYVIGDYIIEYQEEIVCANPYTRATTKNYVSTSHYKITRNGSEQEWYKVVQTTNYTYESPPSQHSAHQATAHPLQNKPFLQASSLSLS